MLVHLCRHGEAFPGEPDEQRELTNSGKLGSKRLGGELAQEARPPLLVLTSPLKRAFDSGRIIAAELGCDVATRHEMRPGADLAKLREALEGLYDLDAVAVVCHQPDVSEILLEAAGVEHGFHVSEAYAFELRPE